MITVVYVGGLCQVPTFVGYEQLLSTNHFKNTRFIYFLWGDVNHSIDQPNHSYSAPRRLLILMFYYFKSHYVDK